MRLRTVFLVLLTSAVVSIGAQTSPKSNPRFASIYSAPLFSLSIDPSTKHEVVDQDGDTLSGAVFKVDPTKPVNVEGTAVTSFIYSVIAVCGHNGVLVARAEMYKQDGTAFRIMDELKAVPIEHPEAPLTVIYQVLCKGKINKQDKNSASKWI